MKSTITKKLVAAMNKAHRAEVDLTAEAEALIVRVVTSLDEADRKANKVRSKAGLALNEALAEAVRDADKALSAKGFNCKDRGGHRYSAENPMHLHYVTPKGAIKRGGKLESRFNAGMTRLRELKDVDKWLKDPKQFQPQSNGKTGTSKGKYQYVVKTQSALDKAFNETVNKMDKDGRLNATKVREMYAELQAVFNKYAS